MKQEEIRIQEEVETSEDMGNREREKPSTLSDIEMLESQSIGEIERNQKSLELPSTIDDLNIVGLSQEEFQQIVEETDINSELKRVEDEGKSWYKTAREKVKKTALAVSVILQLASPAVATAGERPAEPIKQEMTLAPEMEQQQKIYNKKIEEIRDAAIFEDEEQVHYIGKKEGVYEFLEAQPGEKYHGTVEYKEIKRLLDKGMEVEIVHTHPAYLLSHLSNRREALKEGITASVSMPPSITDIFGCVAMKRSFSEDNKNIKNSVVTPFGKYSLSIEEDSKIAKILNELFGDFDKILDKCGLSEEEKATYNEVIDSSQELVGSLHPMLAMNKIIEILKDDRETKTIASKLEKGFMTMGFELLNKYPEAFNDLCRLIDNSKREKEYDEIQTRELIKEDLELYQKNGIIVEYEPFSNVVDME